MKLSGWVRLWIVASLAIWGGGFFWLSSVNYPYSKGEQPSERFPFKMPPLQPDLSNCKPENPFTQFDKPAPAGSTGRWTIEEPDNCRRDLTSNWNFDWSNWLQRSTDAGHLPLIAFGPFILGALMLGVGWVQKGFQPAPEKKV